MKFPDHNGESAAMARSLSLRGIIALPLAAMRALLSIRRITVEAPAKLRTSGKCGGQTHNRVDKIFFPSAYNLNTDLASAKEKTPRGAGGARQHPRRTRQCGNRRNFSAAEGFERKCGLIRPESRPTPLIEACCSLSRRPLSRRAVVHLPTYFLAARA